MNDDGEVRARLARMPRPVMPPEVVVALEDRLAAERRVVPLTGTHRRRLTWLVAAASFAAVAALLGADNRTAPVPPPGTPPVVRAGAVFEPSGFAGQLRQRFRLADQTTPTRTFADTGTGIVSCTRAVRAHGRVLTVDAGMYASTPAVVLVTTYIPNSDYEEVWVVQPSCGTERTLVLHHVVLDVDGSASA